VSRTPGGAIPHPAGPEKQMKIDDVKLLNGDGSVVAEVKGEELESIFNQGPFLNILRSDGTMLMTFGVALVANAHEEMAPPPIETPDTKLVKP